MKFSVSARTMSLVLALAAAPFAALADGHTSEFAGNKGYVGGKGYVGEAAPRPVTQQRYAGNKHNGSQPKRFRRGPILAVPGCPTGFNGMYRGTLYCVNGRPLH